MSWLHEDIAASWRREGQRYAAEINEYVRIGMESGWQHEQKEPDQDQRTSLAADIVRMIRAANQAGDTERLRARDSAGIVGRHGEGEEETAVFAWKDIQSSIKASIPDLESLADEEHPEHILDEVIPFGDGIRLLLVCGYGIYMLESGQAELIHPEISELKQYNCEDTIVDMAHGAVSLDGRWIAYGSQGSEHLLRDLSEGTVYAFEPESSYPHYALFSCDSREVWYNSCHFYNGATIRVQVPGTEGEAGAAGNVEERRLMNEEMRVYAGSALKDGCILGDAYGYLRRIDREGREVWRYFVGSTITGMTVTPDEERLAVATYGGMLHLIDLHSGIRNEYSIGTAPVQETSRWILWRNQEPMRW